MAAGELDHILAVPRLGDNFVAGTFEQVPQVEPDDGLVFREQDAHGAYTRTMRRSTKRTRRIRGLGVVRVAGVEVDGEVELEIGAAAPPDDDDQTSSVTGEDLLNRVAATALDHQVIGVEAHDDHFHFTWPTSRVAHPAALPRLAMSGVSHRHERVTPV